MESKTLLVNANAKRMPLTTGSINCVVTSPPYLGLRSYLKTDDPLKDAEIGIEQSVDEYVEAIVLVFREIWRVLRDDGTVWLNISDSYNGSGGAGGDYNVGGIKEGQPRYGGRNVDSIKPKSLILIPERVVIALQTDGWVIRNDIIWAKGCSGNYTGGTTMPESAKDRFTRAHEYVYFITKNPHYYFDHEAALEMALSSGGGNEIKKRGFKTKDQIPDMQHHGQDIGYSKINGMPARNRRDVWVINPGSYPGAHYATFPTDLIEPCILTGCPDGGVVLDPFVGSGTTCMVARKHSRNAIGLDLNFEYLNTNARERLQYGSFVPVADGIRQLTL